MANDLIERCDAVLHDMGIPQPPMRKQALREFYERMLVTEPAIEALQAENARLRVEVERIKNLVPLAYGEALVDISTRGLNEENIDLIFGTSDAKAAMDCAETHQQEWPDNYDDAMNRAALQQDKEGE